MLSVLFTAISVGLTGCSGGDQPPSVGTGDIQAEQTVVCDGSCSNAESFLTVTEVEQIIAQAVAEAQAQSARATIAVVDRVGNVLAVYRMGDAADSTVLISTQGNIDAGLEGIALPNASNSITAVAQLDDQAAISKAITGAYLSSEGNAFSSRTASQIVQENFNPGEVNQPGGPLFGVQFSQLSCSDFTQVGSALGVGPRRSPLGLSADPGGLPLYKAGAVVGGIGVLADGVYGIDKNLADRDRSTDEMIAFAGTFGFAAPNDRRADRITVEGKTLRFSDVDFGDLSTSPADAPAFSSLPGSVGSLLTVFGYFDGVVRAGVPFGQPASGIRAEESLYPGADAFVFVDSANDNRFAPVSGAPLSGATELSAAEVQILLQEALRVANQARAQIRRPLGSSARVTISVVDTEGNILGMVRNRDAPVFGADVSLQKARTAALFSSSTAAAFIESLPDAKYIQADLSERRAVQLGSYITQLRSFGGMPNALADGTAFSDRAGGNLSRPFFPDGLQSTLAGPLSKPAGEWSPFSTGLQLDLVMNGVLQHVFSVATAGVVPDATDGCVGVFLDPPATVSQTLSGNRRAANGIQIFPGSVPIYRGNVLVGGIGVSGDGVDQDDLIAFLGLHNAGERLATELPHASGAIGNAPLARRADNIIAGATGTRLRYVQCPQTPFIANDDQNVCQGK